MSIDAVLVRLLRPLLARATRGVLREQIEDRYLPDVFCSATRLYRAASQDVPKEKTVGARVMLRLAVFTIALFRSLQAHGVPAGEARALTSEIAWRVYRMLAWAPWKLTRVISNDPLVRVKAAMDLFMRFPYSRPGYSMGYVGTGKRVVAFDVSRCPVAEYFEREGLSDLCTASFCDLDFPLASEWGLELHRARTLARGADHCDFRYCSKKLAVGSEKDAVQQADAGGRALRGRR